MSSDFDILSDLQKELAGDFLHEEVEIRGRKYFMRLLTERENAWTFRFFKATNEVSLAVAVRDAQLSVGIRSIDGIPLKDCVKRKFEALTEPERISLLKRNEDNEHLAAAELFFEFLVSTPPGFVSELHEAWSTLQQRHEDSMSALKKSSGEDLEKEEKQNSTESSPDGNQ